MRESQPVAADYPALSGDVAGPNRLCHVDRFIDGEECRCGRPSHLSDLRRNSEKDRTQRSLTVPLGPRCNRLLHELNIVSGGTQRRAKR